MSTLFVESRDGLFLLACEQDYVENLGLKSYNIIMMSFNLFFLVYFPGLICQWRYTNWQTTWQKLRSILAHCSLIG